MEKKINCVKAWFKRPLGVVFFSAIIALFTLVAYHKPLFDYVADNVEGSGVVIILSFALLILVFDFMFAMLFVRLMRMVGRVIIALSLVANATALYFVNSYEVLLTRDVMGNLFNTRVSEASGFLSVDMFIYIVLLGILPALYVLCRKVEYGSWGSLAKSVGGSLLGIVLLAVVNINNVLWIDRNATKIGALIMPWSYIANTARHFHKQRMINREEIRLPDAVFSSEEPSLMVLIIGESARSANFSLYGYERETNPLLKNDSVKIYTARASATSTTQAVKAILDHKRVKELYEILPNYMYRNGVDVVWRTANWGEPPLHIEKYRNVPRLRELYPDADGRYDGILVEGLREEIEMSTACKTLIVIHTSTSHGPTYNKKYPVEFERFAPVCNTVEMAKADRAELINAYDNTILYTDYLIHSVIEVLRGVDDRKCAMIYVSDHGESLGEGGVYMHGMVSASMAPKEQIEIPFIVWNGSDRELKELSEVGHYHTFHSVMDFLDMRSDFYNEEYSIFCASACQSSQQSDL